METVNCSSSLHIPLDFASRREYNYSNEILKGEIKRLNDIFGTQFEGEIKHIHTKPLGNGAFTLFGIIYDNVFEILLLDPLHEAAKKS